MKWHRYKELHASGDNKKPFNTHLWIEVSSSLWYMVDSANRKVLLKSINKGSSWSTVTTRTQKIHACWHDRTNSLIWFVDCDNGGSAVTFDVWKMTTDGNDTITPIGASATQTDVVVHDIFIIGSNVFVADYEYRTGVGTFTVIWDVDTHPFGEISKQEWD